MDVTGATRLHARRLNPFITGGFLVRRVGWFCGLGKHFGFIQRLGSCSCGKSVSIMCVKWVSKGLGIFPEGVMGCFGRFQCWDMNIWHNYGTSLWSGALPRLMLYGGLSFLAFTVSRRGRRVTGPVNRRLTWYNGFMHFKKCWFRWSLVCLVGLTHIRSMGIIISIRWYVLIGMCLPEEGVLGFVISSLVASSIAGAPV